MPTLPGRGGDIAIGLHCVHINLRLNGAGEGNRTLVVGLGSLCSTIELHPPSSQKGWTHCSPKGTAHRPLSGFSVQTYLAIGYHVEVSTLSRQGDLCIPYPTDYGPAFAFSTILYPLQLRTTLRSSLSAVQARRHIGLTLFRAKSTNQKGPAFSPVIVCQRIRTKQADIRSLAVLARAQSCKSRLAL